MQFRLAHRGLHPQQESIVVIRRVVDPIRVGEECVEDGTLFHKMIPVAARPRQSAHLDPQDDADVIEIHFGEDAMVPGAMDGRLPRGRPVVVDDQDALERPTQFDGVATQVVLKGGRFAVVEDLLRTGLPHVDDGQPSEVLRLDLGRA